MNRDSARRRPRRAHQGRLLTWQRHRGTGQRVTIATLKSDPRSPRYADLLELWGAGESFPLVYSREAVEAETTHRIRLRRD